MSADSIALEKLLQFAVEIAREAGQITLRHFRTPREPERKPDGSFVTEADRAAERHLRFRIAQQFPNDGIVGEEESERFGSTNRRWVIDPVDGTFSFVHGVPLYGVLIGLQVNGDAVLGVAHLPALEEMVYAARGAGCVWNGRPARTSSTSSLDEALLLATDFGVCDRFGFGPEAERIQARVKERRTWGDCYGHVLVATGRAEVMLDPTVKIWDCAALLPILEEAGGTFTDWAGRRTIQSGNAVSTNGLVFESVMMAFREQAE